MARKKLKSNGRENKCKVCNHQHRMEIEQMLIIKGMSGRKVEEYLLDNEWEPVTYATIIKHRNTCIDKQRELKIRYEYENSRLTEMKENGTLTSDYLVEIDEVAIKLR